MIGPALFIGTMLGALVAELAAMTPFGLEGHVGFFALLGMGAMMSRQPAGATRRADCDAQLTDNPEIISRNAGGGGRRNYVEELFGKDSLFVTMLQANGLDYTASPVFPGAATD